MKTATWRPLKIEALRNQIKNRQAKALLDKIDDDHIYKESSKNESLEQWPLKIKRSEQSVTEYKAMLPELWSGWMKREIKNQKDVGDTMDYLEALERRDKIESAAIVLLSEATSLSMHHTESTIRESCRMMLNELWDRGGLGD